MPEPGRRADPGDAIRIVYLAWLRERAGRGEELVRPPRAVASVEALLDWLRARGGPEAAALATAALRVAVNQRFATASTLIGPGDEVAFLPPVTGG